MSRFQNKERRGRSLALTLVMVAEDKTKVDGLADAPSTYDYDEDVPKPPIRGPVLYRPPWALSVTQ